MDKNNILSYEIKEPNYQNKYILYKNSVPKNFNRRLDDLLNNYQPHDNFLLEDNSKNYYINQNDYNEHGSSTTRQVPFIDDDDEDDEDTEDSFLLSTIAEEEDVDTLTNLSGSSTPLPSAPSSPRRDVDKTAAAAPSLQSNCSLANETKDTTDRFSSEESIRPGEISSKKNQFSIPLDAHDAVEDSMPEKRVSTRIYKNSESKETTNDIFISKKMRQTFIYSPLISFAGENEDVLDSAVTFSHPESNTGHATSVLLSRIPAKLSEQFNQTVENKTVLNSNYRLNSISQHLTNCTQFIINTESDCQNSLTDFKSNFDGFKKNLNQTPINNIKDKVEDITKHVNQKENFLENFRDYAENRNYYGNNRSNSEILNVNKKSDYTYSVELEKFLNNNQVFEPSKFEINKNGAKKLLELTNNSSLINALLECSNLKLCDIKNTISTNNFSLNNLPLNQNINDDLNIFKNGDVKYTNNILCNDLILKNDLSTNNSKKDSGEQTDTLFKSQRYLYSQNDQLNDVNNITETLKANDSENAKKDENNSTCQSLSAKKLIFQKVETPSKIKPLNHTPCTYRSPLESITSSSQYFSALSLNYEADVSATTINISPLISPDKDLCLQTIQHAIDSLQKQMNSKQPMKCNSFDSVYSSTAANSEYESALDIPYSSSSKNKLDHIRHEDFSAGSKYKSVVSKETDNLTIKSSRNFRLPVNEKGAQRRLNCRVKSLTKNQKASCHVMRKYASERLTPSSLYRGNCDTFAPSNPAPHDDLKISSLPDICQSQNLQPAPLNRNRHGKFNRISTTEISEPFDWNWGDGKPLEKSTFLQLHKKKESVDSLRECRIASGWVSLNSLERFAPNPIAVHQRSSHSSSVVDRSERNGQSENLTTATAPSTQVRIIYGSKCSGFDKSQNSESESSTDVSIRNFTEAGNLTASSNNPTIHRTAQNITKPKPISFLTPAKKLAVVLPNNDLKMTSSPDLATSFENLVDSILGVDHIYCVTKMRKGSLNVEKDKPASFHGNSIHSLHSSNESNVGERKEKDNGLEKKKVKRNRSNVRFKKSSRSKVIFKECKLCVSKTTK